MAGCGDGSETSTGGDALTLVQGAGDALLAEETARMEIVIDAADQTIRMDGQIDFVNQRASFTTDNPLTGPIEMVQDGTTLFARKTGPWIASDLVGEVAEQALGASGADPRAMLDQLREISTIEVVGSEEIRGVSVTHSAGADRAVRAAARTARRERTGPSHCDDDVGRRPLRHAHDDGPAGLRGARRRHRARPSRGRRGRRIASTQFQLQQAIQALLPTL